MKSYLHAFNVWAFSILLVAAIFTVVFMLAKMIGYFVLLVLSFFALPPALWLVYKKCRDWFPLEF